ncbi:hypothetical protein PsAD5_02144 [Pseudovibrio sp. Ad5]|uniref:hypothetical protein n=1 Tax=Pseudovibrio sp. Ad5 TaxID=989436 RepID=UPI0007AE5A4D|nr:hypothetical protein [Pseudovibrio sp. Ad5]KZK97905.1 hypothetical protein PsAD5_02144 [Pseudovibrio sp. Ad5]
MTEIAKSSEASSHLDQCGEYAAAMDGLQEALRACRRDGEGADNAQAVEAANSVLRAAVGLYQVADDVQIRDAIKFVFENYATYQPDVAKKNAATLFYLFRREKSWVGALYEGGLQCLKTSNRMPEVSAFYGAVAEQQKKLSSELRLIKTIQHS